ncbi:hypothetical protein Ddye_031140 [Dipteronia dyeriana]|uniref:Uncharacterized protein n=1 Tax=Dipteronia dyeriana TaxID=168575 RepID=A0AAD9WND4_9ROSI|nr:hypothetical protein Ddye_031140 [Dipteronia dyeriana]
MSRQCKKKSLCEKSMKLVPIAAVGRNQVAAARRKVAAINSIHVILPSTSYQPENDDDDDVDKRASDFISKIREKRNRNGQNKALYLKLVNYSIFVVLVINFM